MTISLPLALICVRRDSLLLVVVFSNRCSASACGRPMFFVLLMVAPMLVWSLFEM
jgi:hypothetical protein